MNSRLLRSIIFLLTTLFFISSVSAGDVIFRNGKIISSGNVSTDEKFVGDGSKLTNLPAVAETDPKAYNGTLAYNASLSNYRTLTNNNLDQNIIILGNDDNYTFSTLYFYQNSSWGATNPLWQLSHRSQTALKNAFIFNYYNGSNWFSPFIILPNLNVGIGTSTPSEKLEVNGNIKATGNVSTNGKFIGDGSQLTNLPSETDPRWTANSTLVLFTANLPLANRTISHISNITGFSFNYNQTTPAISYVNSQGFLTSSIGNSTYLTNASLSNYRTLTNNNFNVSMSILGDPVNNWSFSTINLYQNATSATNSLWQISHRSESYIRNALTYHYFNGTSWTLPFIILPNLNVGIGTSTPRTKLEVNGATYLDGDVNITGKYLNAPNTNITSLHQSYDITSTTSLDTQYNNTLDRPIIIDVSMYYSYAFTGDIAYVILEHNQTNSTKSYMGMQSYGGSQIEGTSEEVVSHASMVIQPSELWKIESVVGGGGSVSLLEVWKTVI